jgi:outer membrane protein OmpA-like peptidoglycan-associated protein
VASAPDGLQIVHADVYFDFKSTRLRADAVRVLQEKAALMDRDGSWVVLVQGYADRQGPPEYNRLLAQRRADAVGKFLLELGVPGPAVKVMTIGQDGALCDEPGQECQQLNRRVHIEIRKLPAAASASAAASVPPAPVER